MRVEANELHGTDVKLVSLVKRGANRLPWRVTKEDGDSMLDISKYFKKSDPTPTTPDVHSVILRKDAKNPKAIVAVLAKAGFDVSKPVEKGDVIVFTQKAGDPSADAILIKSNQNVGYVVENLSKAFSGYDFSSNDFNDVFATGAFCPSVAMASDLMGVTIGNILSSSENPAEAAGKIAKAVEGFKSYAVTLANSLPVQAFKADVGMSLRGSGSTSYDATMDDKNNTGVNDVKPDKSLEDTEGMKGFTDGMKRPNTNAGSTNIGDAITTGDVNKKLTPTTPAATADDGKAVFQGNKVTGKGGKNTAIATLSRKAEAIQKEAGEAAAAGDHTLATILYKSADKMLKAASSGGVVANTMADEGTDNTALTNLKENQSGAGAQSSNTGANVKKADQVTAEQVAAIVATLNKSADDYEKVGLKKRAESVRAEVAKLLKDGDTSMVTDGNGTSTQATADDAANTAVGATKKKPDPNLEAPDRLDANGWTSKIAGEVTKALSATFGTALDGVRKDVAGLAAQVTSMSGRVEKAEEAVNGTVLNAEPARRDMLGFRAQKADDGDSAPPPIDTGLRKMDPEPNIADIRAYARKGRGW